MPGHSCDTPGCNVSHSNSSWAKRCSAQSLRLRGWSQFVSDDDLSMSGSGSDSGKTVHSTSSAEDNNSSPTLDVANSHGELSPSTDNCDGSVHGEDAWTVDDVIMEPTEELQASEALLSQLGYPSKILFEIFRFTTEAQLSQKKQHDLLKLLG